MDIYWELLQEAGINVTKEELDIKDTPMIIHKNCKYRIPYDENEPLSRYQLNYSDERNLIKYRPHQYSRVNRFKYIFYHLIGCLGYITPNDFKIIEQSIGSRVKTSPVRCYNLVYKFLKKHKWRKYYISIPYIINLLGGKHWVISLKQTLLIINIFEKMHYIFKNNPGMYNRIRFPKLQYIALQLLIDCDVVLPYYIPLARTTKKRKSLNPVYKRMYSAIEDN